MCAKELDIGKIKDCIDKPISETTSLGIFYDLFCKEYFYHERTICYMLKDKVIQKQIVKNLFGEEELGNFEVEKIKAEKITNELRRIDLFFIIKFEDGKRWPVIIELKTATGNHDGQLTHYYQYVKGKFQDSEPKCFYITPDRRKPDAINEKNDIVNTYKCLSYMDVVKGIHSDNPVINDYIKTVEENTHRNEYSNFDVLHIYKELFEKIKEEIHRDVGSASVECWPKNLDQAKDSSDFEKTLFEEGGVYLKLRIEKKGCSLAIERRWEKNGNSTLSSLYYGIWKGEGFASQRYKPLIKHWKECGRELNCDINSKGEIKIKKNKTMKKINKNSWYVIQYLTDWMMPRWDNLKIVKGISDVESWTEWIINDFKLITGNDENGKEQMGE